jgi:hypothetical protein
MSEALSGILPNITEETARRIWAALSDDERRVLAASLNRTERQAAEVCGLSKSGYRYRLKRATNRARDLQRTWELWA